MEKRFSLVFDEVMFNQLKKLAEDAHLKNLIAKMLDKLEELGPRAGELIDSRLFLYEIKSKPRRSGFIIDTSRKRMSCTSLSVR